MPTFHTARLRFALDQRGLTLARCAGKAGVSVDVLTAALAGRSISTRTAEQILGALRGVPVIPGADELFLNPDVEAAARGGRNEPALN